MLNKSGVTTNSLLFIQASNIHNGGGRTLLLHLLESITSELKTVVLVDVRIGSFYALPSNISIRFIDGNLIQRFIGELWLLRNVRTQDHVLCFGNLPPLFSSAGFSTVFVQNRYLVDPVCLANLPLRLRLRLSIERFWLFCRGFDVDQFIVQTPTMLNLVKERAKNWRGSVKMLPFSDQSIDILCVQDDGEKDSLLEVDFIYVASGEAHKNHTNLIKAWCLLADGGFFPTLWLTVSEENDLQLCAFIMEKVKAKQLRIKNLGIQEPSEILLLYKKSSALIYPSTFESFGLPLIEAKQAGIPIIAPELDYVRDVVVPDQTFDPQSPVSIARAVRRFMGWQEAPLPLVDAKEFLRTIMQKSEY
jgi:glycosyltransferase involved in cell wall biosynthesis